MAADAGLPEPVRLTVEVTVRSFDQLAPATAYALWRLRQDVFVVEQECPYPDLDGRDLEPGTRHLLLEDAGTLVGCARVLGEGTHARIGRVAVAKPARGRGIAGELMRAAIDECGPGEVVLDAQTYLHAWYESFGFEVAGPEFLEDGIPHLPMRLRRL